MIKKYLKNIIITSFIVILPMLCGFIIWDKLPSKLPTHWNFQGEIDGWSSKPFAVIFIPLFILAMHIICVVATNLDPKNEGVNPKIMNLIMWICPVISVLCQTSVYAAGLGKDVNIELFAPLIVGMVLLIVGNYLPKCKQNYTIGIKIPWTLNDEENWNKTHRFAGALWTVCSLVIMSGAFFKKAVAYLTFVPIAVMVFVPMIYSYIYYRKHR